MKRDIDNVERGSSASRVNKRCKSSLPRTPGERERNPIRKGGVESQGRKKPRENTGRLNPPRANRPRWVPVKERRKKRRARRKKDGTHVRKKIHYYTFAGELGKSTKPLRSERQIRGRHGTALRKIFKGDAANPVLVKGPWDLPLSRTGREGGEKLGSRVGVNL